MVGLPNKGIMMRKQIGLFLAPLVLMLLAGNVVAQDDDRTDILALMEQAFYAVGSGIPDDARAIQLAEGTSISIRPHPNGNPGELLMRLTTNEALLAEEIDGEHKFMERWTGDPTVMIRGPIAVVWGEYEFWIDGEFSHCGIDAVDLVNVDADWKIANWMWTVEKDNCPTDPATSEK